MVRAYIEHELGDRGLNKLYYIGPSFGASVRRKDVIGSFIRLGLRSSARPRQEASVPFAMRSCWKCSTRCCAGLASRTLRFTSIPWETRRTAPPTMTRSQALQPVVGQMCADCQRRAVTNPLRVFDCKVPEDQPVIATLPVISSYLGEASREHFQNVQALLKEAGVAFEVNPRLVRGLDYYTRTAFEFTHGALGAQNAILGGGRYDGLAELLGSPQPAPGIGFAIGEDRLVMALQARASEAAATLDVYVAPVGDGIIAKRCAWLEICAAKV